MRDQILGRFEGNIARVENLVGIYEDAFGEGGGRRPVHATDILRAATVLLHAALEETLRSLAAWKYPLAGEQVLNEVPLIGLNEHARPEKFFLGKLTAHRHKSIQEVIEESIQVFLNNFTVNNTTDISSFIRKIGVEPEVVSAHYPTLSTVIARRHHIVHQADRNNVAGRGQHQAQAINANTVRTWIATVRQFVADLLGQVPD